MKEKKYIVLDDCLIYIQGKINSLIDYTTIINYY